MRLPRAIVVAILAYVSLDLAMPMIPGAFAFSPDDSVESLQGKRARVAAEAALAVPAAHSTGGPPPLHRSDTRVARPGTLRPLFHRQVSRLPRAALDPVSPSDDG